MQIVSWPASSGVLWDQAADPTKRHLKPSYGQSAAYHTSHEPVAQVTGLLAGNKPPIYVMEVLPITSALDPINRASGTGPSPQSRKSPRVRPLRVVRPASPLQWIHDLASGAVNAVA